MAWVNILDVGEWDIYIQYAGVSWMPQPDSWNNLVLAADLNPVVCSVEIVDGNIELNLEDQSGGGGEQPYLVLMPRGVSAESYRVRMRVIEGQTDLGDGAVSSRFAEVMEVAPSGDDTFGSVESGVNVHNFTDNIPQEWFDGVELGAPIATTSGIAFARIGSGF